MTYWAWGSHVGHGHGFEVFLVLLGFQFISSPLSDTILYFKFNFFQPDQHQPMEFLKSDQKRQTLQLAEQPNRGFKPVISIPIVGPPISRPQLRTMPLDSEMQVDLELISLESRARKVYQDYLKGLRENRMLRTTMEHVNREKIELRNKLAALQVTEKIETEEKKKRHRRNASEILRAFQCPGKDCDKSYGAQASLSQHVKLKHQELYGTPEFELFMAELSRKNKLESGQQ